MSEPGILATYVYETLIVERTPKSVPARFVEDWAQHAIAVIDTKMIPGWADLLVTEDQFLSHMATPAAEGYAAFLAPGRLSRKGLSGAQSTRRHLIRLAASYAKLQASIQRLLVDARADFEQRLLDTQEAYRTGEALPLSLTGDYFEQLLGAAVRQWFFVGVTAQFAQYRWAADILVGDHPPPVPFVRPVAYQDFARRLVRLLIQGGCFLLLHLSLDQVHQDLDTLLAERLSFDYAAPLESTVRLQVKSGLPSIRTELKRLAVQRPSGEPPHCPDISFDIVADFNPHFPGAPDVRLYHLVVIADIQHVATFIGPAEYLSFTLSWDVGASQINMSRSAATVDYSFHGTSATFQFFGIFQALLYVTQSGLPFGVGQGPYFVGHQVRAVDHADASRYMQGPLTYYLDIGAGMAWLGFTSISGLSSGSAATWDIYRVSDGSVLSAGDLILVGQVFEGTGTYTITDNFGLTGTGHIHVRVTGA